MKLLLDQGLPRSTPILLADVGIDAVHVSELGLSEAEDEVILARAREESLIVVTLDSDFHALLALSESSSPSVIRIRIEGLRALAMSQLLQTVIQQCEEALSQGVMITVQKDRIRLRRLPILKNEFP